MPTPVATARQCLTDEAGRALDEAVTVAKRRNHAQTTSLHAISALLSPSFSLLRDSLSRARSSAYSSRLQFRALELCVSVSLDRLPCSKSQSNSSGTDDFAPPISNSLMAAIKRSQAHQRRQPDMYHLNHLNRNSIDLISNSNSSSNNSGALSISCIKVELKHFVLSILDDPIISRVFGEAGFRSSDIKMSIINPPRWTSNSGIGITARRPPIFLCNFGDGGFNGGDRNLRKLSEIMVKSKERNPVLIGVCAKDVVNCFKEKVIKKEFTDLPLELHGIRLICLEKVIKEGKNEELDLIIDEIKSTVEIEDDDDKNNHKVVVNLGEINCLINVNDDVNEIFVKEMVNKVSKLVEICGKNLWLISESGNYESYSKFVGLFPSVEKDWDLQLLPITSSSSSSSSCGSNTIFDPKSSLMGSFVPFGGFFPTPSEFRPPLIAARQPFTRCNACNESYERELGDALREGSLVSVDGDQSSNLPSWLQRAESDTSKAGNSVAQVKDGRNEKISCLQKKWDDHCRLIHQKYPFYPPPVSLPGLHVSQPLGFPVMADMQGSRSNSGDSSLNERASSNSGSSMQIVGQNLSPQNQVLKPAFSKIPLEISECRPSPILAHKPLSNIPVTTNLGLGMIYTSKPEELKKPTQTEQLDLGDFKPLYRKLSETVQWQSEAIYRITEIVSRCKTGNGRNNCTNSRGNVWLSFVGPDRIGQKRVAQALAEAIHGSRDRLIALNLSYQDRTTKPDSLLHSQGLNEFDINLSRITVVDHLAQELCRKPQSVVFLENVDEADPLVQNSLSRAIQTGKFPDSRGKEIATNNVVFVTSSTVTKDEKSTSPRKEFIKFLEEKILEAKNWQMQLAVRSVSSDAPRSNETTVSLLSPKGASAKRKLSGDLDDTRQDKKTKKSLDLNLSLEMDFYEGDSISDGSKAWLEHFCSQVDGNVAFKPFNFDALADTLLRKIRLKLEENLRPGQRVSLEIDHEVMSQILAAAWFSDKKGAAEEWIELVLGPNLSEAWERYHMSDESVVRLCSCDGVPVKEWAPGIRLPRRINMSI